MKPEKVVYFLGAGATQFLDLPITNEFLQRVDYQANHPTPPIMDFTPQSDYYKLYNEIKNYYLQHHKKVDIEFIYTKVIEFWNDIRQIRISDDNLNFLLYYFFREVIDDIGKEETVIKESFIQSRHNEMNEKLQYIKQAIEFLVYEAYWIVLDDVQQLSAFDKLFSVIWNNNLDSRNISIFTTNYDLIIEDYFNYYCQESDIPLQMEDGFTKEGRFQVYNPERFIRTRRIRLFKIHGSVDRCTLEGINKPVKIETHYPYTEKKYMNKTITNRLLIYPILNKINYDNQPTGQFEIRELAKRIRNANLIIVLGFSFRDRVIVDTIIKNSNTHQWLLIISPDASVRKKELKSRGLKARTYTIEKPFPKQITPDEIIIKIKSMT